MSKHSQEFELQVELWKSKKGGNTVDGNNQRKAGEVEDPGNLSSQSGRALILMRKTHGPGKEGGIGISMSPNRTLNR